MEQWCLFAFWYLAMIPFCRMGHVFLHDFLNCGRMVQRAGYYIPIYIPYTMQIFQFCRRHFGHCQTNRERNRFGKFEVGGVMNLLTKAMVPHPFTEWNSQPYLQYCDGVWFLFKHRCTCFALLTWRMRCGLHSGCAAICEVSVWLCAGWHGSVGHHCGTYHALRGWRQLLIWETLKLRDPIFLILYFGCFEIHGLTCLTD